MYKHNQKGIISVIFALVIVIGIIGSIIYVLIRKPIDADQLSGVKTSDEVRTTPLPQSGASGSAKTITNNTTTKNKSMDTNEVKVAKKGDTLVMNYTGKLVDGTVFDSNVDPKFGHVQPFEFILGAHQVITGWDEGLVGMKIGEKKVLTIPPEKGYGAAGAAGGKIPPNATLVFDVELVGIQ